MEVVLTRLAVARIPSRPPRELLRVSCVIAIASATFIVVCINLLAASFDRRLDATIDHRYSLSTASRDTLVALTEPTSIYVFLSRGDPMASTVKQLLEGYLSLSRALSLRWIDPDHDPGQYLAVQSQLGMVAGASQQGRSIGDAIIVLERGKRRTYLTTEDVVAVDTQSGEAEPKLEQAITRGLRRLLDDSRPTVCFTQGHRELALQDTGADGLSELKARIERESVALETVDLGSAQSRDLMKCHLVVVAGPEIPLSSWAQHEISNHFRNRGSLWVLSSTVPANVGQVRAIGLSDILADTGISIGNNVVVETDPSLRLPDGFGEIFFAHPIDHPATHSLCGRSSERDLRVLVALAPSLNITGGSAATSLLTSSKHSFEISDVGAFLADGNTAAVVNATSRTLAAALERDAQADGAKHRLIVAPASIVLNRAQRLPALVGNRAIVDTMLTWLLARPVGVEIATSHRTALQFALSDSDISLLRLYVLAVAPSAVVVLGLVVLIHRYRQVKPRRRAPP